MAEIFDKVGALDRVAGDVVLLKDLVRLCHEQCDSRLMVFMHDVRHKDLVAVSRHAHLFKGSLGNVGAAEAYEAALALEQAARGNEVERIEPLADALVEAINRYFAFVAESL